MSERKFNLSPDDYKVLLEGIELIKISLVESNTKLTATSINFKSIDVNIEESIKYDSIEKDLYNILHSINLLGKNGKHKIIQIKATFSIIIKSQHNLNSDFFDIYKEYSLPLNSWPFFREFVSSMTSRMGVPPLTLPFIKR